MRIVAVSGYKDSGKSTLCRALLARLQGAGLRVGYIKRTLEFVASPAGTDSGDVAAMGMDALLWGETSLCLERVSAGIGAMDPNRLAGIFFPEADVVILEGGKDLALPKIWVGRPNDGDISAYPGVFAVYDRDAEGDGADLYGAEDIPRLAARVEEIVRRSLLEASVYIDDERLPVKDFISDFIAGAVRGMLGSLKGVPDRGKTGSIRLYLRDGK